MQMSTHEPYFSYKLPAINGTVRIIYRGDVRSHSFVRRGTQTPRSVENLTFRRREDALFAEVTAAVRTFGDSCCSTRIVRARYRGTQEGAGYPRAYRGPGPRSGSGAAASARHAGVRH